MTYEEETEVLLKAAERLRKLGFEMLAKTIEAIANEKEKKP
jgi:hypothetical protein